MDDEDLPIRDRLIEELREDIRTLRLPPSLKLTHAIVQERFSVGQSSIREALSALSGEGLVERASRKGFRVKPMTVQDFRELTDTRAVIETALLTRAVSVARPNWNNEVSAALRLMLQNDHRVGDERPLDRAWEAQHRRFHHVLVDGHRSATQQGFLNAVYDQFDRYRTLAIPRRAFLATTANDHREMAEAAIAGDAVGASVILERHIRDTSEAILTNIGALKLSDVAGNIHLRVVEAGKRHTVPPP
jgi:GntR family transcriptional regulator, carbon starvation induced regulator